MWLYIKNVQYADFADIQQARGGQAVTNMWNGMRFDSEAGRKTVEAYVTTPHYGNMLVYQKNGQGANASRALTNGGGLARTDRAPINGPIRAPINAPVRAPINRENNNHRGIENVRNVRGGFVGQSQRGAFTAGRNNQALIVSNWREPAPAQQQPSIGQVLGVVEDDEKMPTVARHGLGITSNDGLPSRFDGSAETAAAPRPGQFVTCFVDENGKLVPLTPSQSNASFNMGPRDYIRNYTQQLRNSGNDRGNATAEAHQGTRGGGDGKRGLTPTAESFTPGTGHRGQHNPGGSSFVNQPMSAKPNVLPQQAQTLSPSLGGYPALQHKASAANLSPRKHQAIASFIEAAAPLPEVSSSEPRKTEQRANNQDSYPSDFKSADSMAGYVPSYLMSPPPKPENTVPPVPAQTNMLPQLDTGSSRVQFTPDMITTPSPITVDCVESHLEQVYYSLMANKYEINVKLAALGPGNELEYFRLMASKSATDERIRELAVKKDNGTQYADGSIKSTHSSLEADNKTTHTGSSMQRFNIKSTHSSLEADNMTTHTGSSIQRFNISGVYREDGRRIDSISMRQGSPRPSGLAPAKLTRAGLRSHNDPMDAMLERQYTRDLQRNISSPNSSSVAGNIDSPPSSKSDSVADTGSVSDSVNDSVADYYGDGGVDLTDF